MSALLNALARGKTSDIRSVSRARLPDPVVERKVIDTLSGTISSHRRAQLLFDSSVIYQYLCVYNNVVGYFTNPTILDRPRTFCRLFSDGSYPPAPLFLLLLPYELA